MKRISELTVGAYEAKTHLPRLLDQVAAGHTITITKHGLPIATLSPVRADPRSTQAAAVDLLRFRRSHRLRGVRIRDLIDEGRRR